MSDAERKALVERCKDTQICVWYTVPPLRKALAAGITASALVTSSAAAHATLESYVAIEQVPETGDAAAMEAWEEATRVAREPRPEDADATSDWCEYDPSGEYEMIIVGGTVTRETRWVDESVVSSSQPVLPEIEAGEWLPTQPEKKSKP